MILGLLMQYLNWKTELILKWLLFFMAIYGHILFRHWFSTFKKKVVKVHLHADFFKFSLDAVIHDKYIYF